VERLRPAEHRRERLERRPHDVHLRLLRRERHPRRLRVEPHQPRARVLRPVALPHLARPDPPRRPVLRDLLEEVQVRVEEEREPRREVVHVEPPLDPPLHVREPVRERERELLRRRRPRLPDVVAGDRDRMPLRHLPRAELDHVRHQPHRRLGREDVLLLRDVLLEDVRLDRPAQLAPRHPLLLTDAEVEREQHRRRRVDRHRRRDLVERDPGEQRLHVVERVDRDALAADLPERPRVIRVVAHQRRHVEGRRQPRLPVLEQVPEPRVRLLGRPEPGELPHRPQPPAVHRRVDAARERIDAGIPQVAVVVDLDVVGRVQRLVLDPRDRREELALPLRRALVQLLAPGGGAVETGARILGRRHAPHLTAPLAQPTRCRYSPYP